MGVKIKQDMDTLVDSAANITGSATGWASRMVAVAEALKSGNNELGSAALADTTTTGASADSGKVPALNASGKINPVQLPTATGGGSGSAGLIPLLNASGQIAASMISGSAGGGGGGPKGLWVFDETGGSYSSTTRQWSHSWTPRNAQNQLVDVSSILIIATGGGGSGSFGPPAAVLGGRVGGNPSQYTPGYQSRKGGGGAGGSTVIAIRTGISSASSFSVKVGSGGAARPHTGTGDAYNGAASTFGSDITAGGGGAGLSTGNGGTSGDRRRRV